MAANTETLTIASGQTESGTFLMELADQVSIGAPGTLPETVTLHSSLDGTTYQPHQSGGADIALTAGKNISTYPLKVHSIKLVSGAAVAADRAFIVRGDGV